MCEERTEIENLLRKLQSGTTDDRCDALLEIPIKSYKVLDEGLKKEIRSDLTPIVEGRLFKK
jgi:hypothetical protein